MSSPLVRHPWTSNRRPSGRRLCVIGMAREIIETRRCPPRSSQCFDQGFGLLSGGACDRCSTSCDQIPVRRFALRGGWNRSGADGPGSSREYLARNERTRSRLKAAMVNPRRTVIFTWPKTRKNPRAKSTKAPLSAALTDSTTWRRPIEMRQAVVPKGMR